MKTIFGKDHGLDQKSVDFLTKALDRSNLPGFDYIEFKQSLDALSKLNLEEETAFKSAFATASTVGLTKTKLLQTAGHYKNVLANEKTQFDSALHKQIEQKVAGKEGEVNKLKDQIVKHQEKIKQLQDQIAKFQKTIDGADAQIDAARKKIESTRDGFVYTHQSILNQIDVDIENIKKYL